MVLTLNVQTVAAWGNNDSGQTTVPAGLSNVVAIAAGYYHSLALTSNGSVVAWGYNGYRPDNGAGGSEQRGGDCGGWLSQSGAQERWDGWWRGGTTTTGQTTVPAG